MQDQKTFDNVLTLTNHSGPIILDAGNLWCQVLLHYTELPENLPQSLENFNPKTKIYVCFEREVALSQRLMLSRFLSKINTLALQLGCRNVTLIAAVDDLKKIDPLDINSLKRWLVRAYHSPLFFPLISMDRRLFNLFLAEVKRCGEIHFFYGLVYLLYESSKFSENFLPYLSENIKSGVFITEFNQAANLCRARKKRLYEIVARFGKPYMKKTHASSLTNIFAFMKTMACFTPMFEELEDGQALRVLQSRIDSGDHLEKENKPEERRGAISATHSSNKRSSPGGDLELPKGVKRLHMGR